MEDKRPMDDEGLRGLVISNVDFDTLAVWGSKCVS